MNLRRFMIYAAVGATGTSVQYVTLFALVQLHICGPLVASCVGAVAGAITNYGMNYRFTFQSSEGHSKTATRFFIVAECWRTGPSCTYSCRLSASSISLRNAFRLP
jgi:putative flippase GtrA